MARRAEMIPEAQIEQQETTLPDKLDAVIVLGKNWRELPPNDAGFEWQTNYLSRESRLSALAAGELWRQGKVEKIIITGGKTGGNKRLNATTSESLSEAGMMAQFLLKTYTDLSPEQVVVEDAAIDTSENAELVKALLKKHDLKQVGLLTVGFHLPRALQLFKTHGIEARGLVSEEEVVTRSKHHAAWAKGYPESRGVKLEQVREFLARQLLVIDPKGRVQRTLAQWVRGGPKAKD